MAVALTRVTVGNTAWPFSKLTPSPRSRHRLGVSSGVIASGRSPSRTRTRLSVAPPALAGCAATTRRPSAAATTIVHRAIVFSLRFFADPDRAADDGVRDGMHIYEGQMEPSDVRYGPRHRADR